MDFPRPVADEQAYPERAQAWVKLLTAHHPNLCFVDVTRNSKDALATIHSINQTDQGIGVVALLPSNDPELILKCFKTRGYGVPHPTP